jgi:hypothetical protein
MGTVCPVSDGLWQFFFKRSPVIDVALVAFHGIDFFAALRMEDRRYVGLDRIGAIVTILREGF